MHNHWIAAAMLALAAPVALAQSSVTIYGRMDAGLVHGKFNPANGSKEHLISGPYTASRLGFRGSEDLGGGLRANFALEAGLNLANGSGGASGGGLNFNRGSQVALAHPAWGELALGRMYMPTFWVYLASDPGIGGLGLGSMGAAIIQQHTALTGNSGWGGFYDDTVRYRTPTWGGVKAEFAYRLHQGNAGALSADDGRTYGMNLQYEQGPLYLGAAYLRNTVALAATAGTPTAPARLAQDEDQTSWMLAARYKLAPATIGVNYGRVRNNVAGSAGACVVVRASGEASGCDMDTFLVSTRIDVGTHGAVDLSVAQLRATSGGLDGARARSFAVGYTHYLSKRTWLYGQAVKMQNNDLAPWGLNAGLGSLAANGTRGFSPHALSVGLLHMF